MEDILTTDTDYDKLSYVWSQWREVTGKKIRSDYKRYVDLSNEAARANGRPDIKNYADLWLEPYEMDNFTAEIDALWKELKPFYDKLHGFVRYKLKNYYQGKTDAIREDGPIPAHILGMYQ